MSLTFFYFDGTLSPSSIKGVNVTELSWLMKLRIAAAAAVGVILIGILAWPLAAPSEPFGAVSLLGGDISLSSAITLAGLAILTGLLAYFLSWPYGREIGILAVPAGLAIWAARSGSIAGLMQQNPTLAQRQEIFATLKWEPLFWLAIVAAGFAGVLLAQKIRPNPNLSKNSGKPNSRGNIYLNAAAALVGSGFIALFCISIFAQGITMPDSRLGSVVGQPATGQIAFAVLVSFGLAAFVVKKFLNASYIWPTIASAFIAAFAISFYTGQDILQRLAQHSPAVFFSNAAISILPVQMVAFGTLGSIAGYWQAVRYNYWRKHKI